MIMGHVTGTVINPATPAGFETLGTPIPGSYTFTRVDNCQLEEHRTKRDINDITDVSMGRWRLFAPGWAPLTDISMFAVGIFTVWPLPAGTDLFIADGKPAFWRGRNGLVHHIELYMRDQGG